MRMKCLLVVNSMPDILFFWADQAFTDHINKQSNKEGFIDANYNSKEIDLNAASQFLSPLITSLFYMNELDDPYSSISCDDGTVIVFKQFYELCFMVFNGDGDESEDFLKRKLSVFHRITTMHFGASLELLKPDIASSRKQIWKNLGNLIDTWSLLSMQQQSFLVEAIERIQVNQALSGMSIGLLNTALGMTRNKGNQNAVRALLLVNSKLLALYSSRNASELEAADILMITVFVNNIFSHPSLEIPCSTNRVPPPLSHQFLKKAGPSVAYSVRTGDCTDAGLSGEGPVIGSTPLFQGSTPSAPVDIALSENFSAKETFDSESQGSSVEEFYSPPSTLECTPDTPRGSMAQTDGTLPPSEIACRAEKFYTPRAPTPEKLKKLARDADESAPMPCGPKVNRNCDEEPEVEPRSEYFRQTVFLRTPKCPYVPHVLHFVQISPGTVLVLVSEVKLSQVAVPVHQALAILSRLGVKSGGQQNALQAQNLVHRLESCIRKIVEYLKGPVGAAVENQLRSLRQRWELVKRNDLQGFVASNSAAFMPPLLESSVTQMGKSLRSLFSVLFCTSKEGPGPVSDKLLNTISRVQEMLQQKLKDYDDYLLVKGQRNVTMTALSQLMLSYILTLWTDCHRWKVVHILSHVRLFPGLVHFIYVDRTSDQVIAPSINTTPDRVFDSRDPCHVIKQKIWDMWNYIHTYVVQGCTFAAVRDGDFLYSYCLWFEDSSGKPVPLQNPIPVLLEAPPLGILCGTYFKDMTRHGFPAVTQEGAVRCYELMCVHLGLVPVRFAAKHIRQLASALFETSLGAHYPISLIQ